MAHNNTVLAQFLKLVPRHEFERDARRHHQGRKLLKVTCEARIQGSSPASRFACKPIEKPMPNLGFCRRSLP